MGRFARALAVASVRSKNWVARQGGPRDPDQAESRARRVLRPEVAEHRPVDGAGHRDPVVADRFDVDDVPNARRRCGLDEALGLDVVALLAGEVDDRLDPRDGRRDAVAGCEVCRRVLHAGQDVVLASAAAGDPDSRPIGEEGRDDEAPRGRRFRR